MEERGVANHTNGNMNQQDYRDEVRDDNDDNNQLMEWEGHS